MNLSSLMREHLPEWLMERILKVGRVAEHMGWRAFLVGGFVRDLILGRRNFDLDVAIEGDGIGLAKEIAGQFGAKLTVHERFLTATVHMSDGTHIDLASCRKERYMHPAALPIVEPATAEEDLLRRDFSINAIALSILPKQLGDVLDVCGGISDLHNGLIRVLHGRSFIDDPTRAFRAIRFEQRFSFRIEEQTECLMREAIESGMIALLTHDRIKHEWIKICAEPDPAACILRMAELEMVRWIDDALSISGGVKRTSLKAIKEIERLALEANLRYERWLLYLMPLIDGADNVSVAEFCRRYSLSVKHAQALMQIASIGEALCKTASLNLPSAVKGLWDAFAIESVMYAAARAQSIGLAEAFEWLAAYIESYRRIRADITGGELISAGIPPGPWIGVAISEALKAKLDEDADRQRQLEVALEVATKMASVSGHAERKERSHTCGGLWEEAPAIN